MTGRKEGRVLSSHTRLMKMTKQAIIQSSMQTMQMSMTFECLKHSNVNQPTSTNRIERVCLFKPGN